jgi:hypothetical protein
LIDPEDDGCGDADGGHAKVPHGERGYDADWFRHSLIQRGFTPCIPSKANRKSQSRMIAHFIVSDTASRICSEKSSAEASV